MIAFGDPVDTLVWGQPDRRLLRQLVRLCAQKNQMAKKKRVAKKSPSTIERRIYFFQPQEGCWDYPAADVLERIAGREGDRRIVLNLPDDEKIRGRVLKFDDVICLRLSRIRYAGLPTVDEHGEERDLDLAESAGLSESSHFVFFPSGIVGYEFNFYGPRESHLTQFFAEEEKGRLFAVQPILNHDAAGRLRRAGELTLATIRVSRNAIEEIEHNSETLGRALRGLAEATDTTDLEVTLRSPKGRSRSTPQSKSWSSRMKAALLPLLDSSDGPTYASKLRANVVLPESNRVGAIDLLADKFVHTVVVHRTSHRGRGVDTGPIVREIQTQYDQLESELMEQVAKARGE